MKSILAVAVLMLAILVPVNAQTLESVRVPFAILIDNAYSREYEGGCRLSADPGFISFDAAPTPYGPLVNQNPSHGRYVNGNQSPIPGTEGCLFEVDMTLDFAESYAFQLEVHAGSGQNWIIDMGTMRFDEILAAAPGPIVYYLDDQAFATGMALPIHQAKESLGTPEPEPDYLATIEAQQEEIDSLKATIEALENP